MKAKRVDGNQAEIVQALRDAGHLVAIFSHIGNGIPDLCVSTRRHCVRLWLECKTPGEKLTKIEAATFDVLPGGPVQIARSAEEALEICEDADWEADE